MASSWFNIPTIPLGIIAGVTLWGEIAVAFGGTKLEAKYLYGGTRVAYVEGNIFRPSLTQEKLLGNAGSTQGTCGAEEYGEDADAEQPLITCEP